MRHRLLASCVRHERVVHSSLPINSLQNAFISVRANVAAALDWIRGFSSVNDVLQRLDPASTERVLDRLRRTLAEHLSEQGVWFDSRAWIVTANRR